VASGPGFLCHPAVHTRPKITFVCIVALVLLVRRLNSDSFAAFCFNSLAEKVYTKCKLLATHILVRGILYSTVSDAVCTVKNYVGLSVMCVRVCVLNSY